ncbi:hypothetical protein SGRIM128S_08002 [Streptomyces griseomycini]
MASRRVSCTTCVDAPIARAADAQDAAALHEGADAAHRGPSVTAPRCRTARLPREFVNAATTALETGDDYDAVTNRAVRPAVAAPGGSAADPRPGEPAGS